MLKSNDITVGKIFESRNYGYFKVVDIKDHLHIKIEFLSTKFVTTVQASKIRTGGVKDLLMPKIYGLGFHGVGDYKATINGIITPHYNRWFGMLERCYSPNAHIRFPTYVDCTVHPLWFNYQNFAKWFDENKPLNADISKYDLDKDIKVKGNRMYGPNTCSIVLAETNIAFSKENKSLIKLVCPNGELFEIDNVSKFAKSKDLQPTLLWKVIKGLRNHHKGWRLSL